MKGFFLERISESLQIKCCGYANGSTYVVCGNKIEFIELLKTVKMHSTIEWAITNNDEIYAILCTGIYIIKDMKIAQEIPIDFSNVSVKEAWYKKDRIFMLADNEVLVYSIKMQKLHRYVPYGHQILNMSLDYSGDNEFILLLTSCDQTVVRTMQVSDELEEIGQVSVPKEVYKVYSTVNKGFLAVEKDGLLLQTDNISRRMCFGGPLVRTGCIISDSTCLLSMLTDELCMIDLNEFIIMKYISTDKIVTEFIVKTETDIYIYNRRGDMGVLEIEGIRKIRQGYSINKMKTFNEYGIKSIYMLKQTGHGNAITKISKKRKRSLKYEIDVENQPSMLGSDDKIVFLKYSNGFEIISENGNRLVKIKTEVVAYGIAGQSEVHFITKAGNICTYARGHIHEYCKDCDYYKKSTPKELRIQMSHTHLDRKQLICADIYESELIYATVDGVYAWSCFEHKKMYLGKYMAISLAIYKGKAIIGQQSETTIIDTKLLVTQTLPIAGRRIQPINDTDYLLHKYDGSLWIISGENRHNICTGSILIRNVSYSNDSVLINTMNSTILIYINVIGLVHAEYLENIGSSGVSCLTPSNVLLTYKNGKVSAYDLHAENEYNAVDTVYNEDILDFAPFGEYMIVISSKDRKIATSPVSLEVETAINIKLYCNLEVLDEALYTNVHSVHTVKLYSHLIVGVNTKSRFMLIMIGVKNGKLEEVYRTCMELANILGMAKNRNSIYCTTTEGLIAYSLKETKHKKEIVLAKIKNIQTVDAEYKIEKSYLMEYILSQIKLYKIDGKASVEDTPVVYIDRMKSKARSLGIFNNEYFLLGHSEKKKGIVYILKKKNQYLNKIFSTLLPSGIVSIQSASLSLIKRAESLFIQTENEEIYRMAFLDDIMLKALFQKYKIYITEKLAENSTILFSSEAFICIDVFSKDDDVSICREEKIFSVLSELL